MFSLSPLALETGSFILKAALIGAIGGFVYNAGWDAREALEIDRKEAIRETRTAVVEAAASAIAGIKIENRTVVQRTRERMVAVPAYRDCQHDDRVFDDLNKQLRGASAPTD